MSGFADVYVCVRECVCIHPLVGFFILSSENKGSTPRALLCVSSASALPVIVCRVPSQVCLPLPQLRLQLRLIPLAPQLGLIAAA